MNRETYLENRKALLEDRKEVDQRLSQLSKDYIKLNTPCKVDDLINIVLESGRNVKGHAKTFGILKDQNVHVTSYKDSNTTKYITVPNQSVTLL